ncbi:aspartate aminotransferase family protein [Candidatus Entotheonella serta]|nr:aspartate aminotransferase family protein [Candidatus Entotheonella serta]
MKTTELLTRRQRLLGVSAPLFYEEPVNIVRGEGVWLFDADGRRYLDMYNNVPCVGHAHPHVVEAMRAQAATLNVHSRYLHSGILDYAERLLNLHAEPLTSTIFACTGTEANEVALQMARAATGGRGIICTDAAYHGNSTEVGKLTRVGQAATGDVRGIPFPQSYRPLRHEVAPDDLSDVYLAEVQAAIDGFAADGIPFAGMLVCPLLANEGLPNIPTGFMTQAAALVRDAGGLFIADEVQAGFGRTGRWWGYEVMEVEPDIATMGKPMGSGLPLSGVAARSDLVDTFREHVRYFNTFAASPLQAAVGMGVLDVIEDEDLLSNVAEVGGYLRNELRGMQDRYAPMADVRGHGLFIGLEWISDTAAKTPDREGAIKMVNHLKHKGFLIGHAGALGNVLKIRPPLVFKREHADAFLTAFTDTMRELYGTGG